MKKILFIGILGLFSSLQATNTVQKVFHHRMENNQKLSHSMELGSLIFYFSEKPTIVPEKNSTQKQGFTQEHIFIFSNTKAFSPEVLAMIEKCNATKGAAYSIRLDRLNDEKGMRLILNCDTRKVLLEYDLFDAINKQKGAVFRFFNKELVEQLSKKNKGVLQVACNKNSIKDIIIDCGHGGSDVGAIGHFALQEKDIVLDIGLQCASLLEKKGFNVKLTRRGDVFLPLDARTLFANNLEQVDLFVSIHANHAANPLAAGVETYFLEESLLRPIYSTMQEYEKKMITAYKEQRDKNNKKFADCLHKTIITMACQETALFKDRSVRSAVSQVLLGSFGSKIQALVELGYLSNKDNAQALRKASFRYVLAQALAEGIMRFASC